MTCLSHNHLLLLPFLPFMSTMMEAYEKSCIPAHCSDANNVLCYKYKYQTQSIASKLFHFHLIRFKKSILEACFTTRVRWLSNVEVEIAQQPGWYSYTQC